MSDGGLREEFGEAYDADKVGEVIHIERNGELLFT
jgi:hypothetical protein